MTDPHPSQMVFIRPAYSNDASILADLNRSVQEFHAHADPLIFRKDTEVQEVTQFFRDVIKASNSHVLIAENADAPLGYVWFETQHLSPTPFTYGTKRVFIHHIAMSSEARRRGIGTLLLRSVEAEARKQEIADFALDTWSFNVDAHRFFIAAGFQFARLVMAKTIG